MKLSSMASLKESYFLIWKGRVLLRKRKASTGSGNGKLDKVHAFVKSPITSFLVIPAKAGIQVLRALTECLDPGDPVPAKAGNRGDDFLRTHQCSMIDDQCSMINV